MGHHLGPFRTYLCPQSPRNARTHCACAVAFLLWVNTWAPLKPTDARKVQAMLRIVMRVSITTAAPLLLPRLAKKKEKKEQLMLQQSPIAKGLHYSPQQHHALHTIPSGTLVHSSVR